MPVCDLVEVLPQFWRIHKVAIVGKADTIRTVDVKGLSLSTCT